MGFNPSPTELTTAATDAALGVMCLALLVLLRRLPTTAPWKTSVWASVFALLATGSVLGAVAHGLDLPDTLRTALWVPLYLSLGLSVALFLVGAVADWRGERLARAVLPWALGGGIGFFIVTQVADTFVVFIAYEGVVMMTTLTIYVGLWKKGAPGAGTVALGIALTLAAAALQASDLRARIVWDFDHNGLFHLLQMVAIVVIARGVRMVSLQRQA